MQTLLSQVSVDYWELLTVRQAALALLTLGRVSSYEPYHGLSLTGPSGSEAGSDAGVT